MACSFGFKGTKCFWDCQREIEGKIDLFILFIAFIVEKCYKKLIKMIVFSFIEK